MGEWPKYDGNENCENKLFVISETRKRERAIDHGTSDSRIARKRHQI